MLQNALVNVSNGRLELGVMTIFSFFTYGWTVSLYLSFESILELLVLKNAAQRTSQRLKWTSGARVMAVVHARFDVSWWAREPVSR